MLILRLLKLVAYRFERLFMCAQLLPQNLQLIGESSFRLVFEQADLLADKFHLRDSSLDGRDVLRFNFSDLIRLF